MTTKLVIIGTMIVTAVELAVALATSWTGVGAVAGVAATVVTAAATLALGWHRPSDVVGAAGVVAAWAAIAGAWAAGKPTRPSPSSRRETVRLIA